MSLKLSTPLLPAFTTRIFNQQAAHGFGRRDEKMSSTVPLPVLVTGDQAEIGLMHKGGRLQRLARLFLSELGGGQLTQFVVNQRQKLRGSCRISPVDRRENAGDVVH